MPINPLIAAAVRALLGGGPASRSRLGGWHCDDRDRPIYRHLGKSAGEVAVSVDADGGDVGWAVVEGITPFTLDVLLSVLAQLSDPRTRGRTKFPMARPEAVSASRIIRYKGMARWGEDRREMMARIDDEMGRLQALRFDLLRFPAWDPGLGRWNAGGITVSGLRLFEATEAFVAPPVGAKSAPRDRVWLVRLGQWTQWWLNTQGKVWTGPLPGSLIELDHRKNRGIEVLAKRIAINAFMLWGAVRARAATERRIESLIEDIGELPPPNERTAHWAGRLRDRFDEALMLLKEQGLIDDVVWPERFEPGARDRNKGWVEAWLASKIVLTRPARYFGAFETAATPQARRRSRPANRGRKSGTPQAPGDLRQIRLRHGLSQAAVAAALGVSPSYLSQVETGRISPSERLSGSASAYFARMDANSAS